MPVWKAQPYIEFCAATTSSKRTTNKRKREDVSSSALQISLWEGIWQRLYYMVSPEMQGYRKRLEEDVRLAEERMRMRLMCFK